MSGSAEIVTQRLVLRLPEETDSADIERYISNYNVAKMLSRVPYPYPASGALDWIKTTRTSWAHAAKASDLSFAIALKGALIGVVGFKMLQETPEIGYWLGEPFWGKGYMSEAVQAALGWLFATTSHQLVAGEAMNDNPGSLHVMQNAGFVVSGASACVCLSRGGQSIPATRLELQVADFIRA